MKVMKASAVLVLFVIHVPTYAACGKTINDDIPHFEATKKWPMRPEIRINAVVSFQIGSGYSSDERDGLYDLYVELANSKNGKVIANLCVKSAFSSDAMALKEISIDTAPYILSKSTDAFGIKGYYANNSRTNPSHDESLMLISFSNKKLGQLTKSIGIYDHSNEISLNEECSGTFNSYKKTISISKESHNGLFDLIISKNETEGKLTSKNGECAEKIDVKKNQRNIIIFNGSEYEFSKNLEY